MDFEPGWTFDGLEWLDFLDVGCSKEEACLSAKTAIK